MKDETKDKESWIHIILDDSLFLYLQLVPFQILRVLMVYIQTTYFFINQCHT